VFRRGTNLRRIARVNDLSRRLELRGKLTNPRQIKAILNRINTSSDYSAGIVILMAAASSAFFTLMFGGRPVDAVSAFFIGFVLRSMLIYLERIPAGLNSFIVSLLSGALISVLADLIGLTPLTAVTATVMIGTLMQVVPGLALVNSIRDIISGDLMSGAARFLDACMIAAGLSIGSVTGMLAARIVTGSLQTSGLAVTNPSAHGLFFAALWSFGASACCAFYFNTDKIDSLIGGLLGSIGWVLYIVVLDQTGSTGESFLAGAFAVAFLSEVFAFFIRDPATVFLLPGLLPLVPGGGIFFMMRAAVEGELDVALHIGYETIIAAGAIALGIALASSAARIGTLVRHSFLKR